MLKLVGVVRIFWPKTGVAHYHAQLGLPDKGIRIEGKICGKKSTKKLPVYLSLNTKIP